MEIAGKTGTAGDGLHGPSHGWFAGTGYLGREEVVVVIYVPMGNGADAARLAHDFFLDASAPAPDSARLLTVELFSTRTVKLAHGYTAGTADPNPGGMDAERPFTSPREPQQSKSRCAEIFACEAMGRKYQRPEGGPSPGGEKACVCC